MNRHLKALLKYSYYCCVLLIVLFALCLQAARAFIEYIDDYRVPIQNYISAQTATQVSVDKIAASWYGLRPKVSVDGLLVKSAQQVLLTASRAEMEVDILASVWYRTVVWRAVDFADLGLTAVQNQRGVWSIAGFAAEAAAAQNRRWRYRSPGDLFLSVKSVNLSNTRLTLIFRSAQRLQATIPEMTIRNDGHFHRLSAATAIGDTSVFNFHLEGEGNPASPETFTAKAYLQLTQFPIGRLLELFSSTNSLPVVSKAIVNSQLWLDFDSPGDFSLSGNLDYSGDAQGSSLFDIPLRATLGGRYQLDRGWDLSLRNLSVDKLTDIESARVQMAEGNLALSLPRLDVGVWSQWLSRRLPYESFNNILHRLSVTGELENLHVSAPQAQLKQVRINANVNDVSANSWKGVPALKNVSGFIDSTLTTGFVWVDTVNFALHPEQIYRQPLIAKRAQGQIGWSLAPDDNAIKIYGNQLELSGDFGKAGGYFLLNTPWEKNSRESVLSLQVGLQDSSAAAAKQFVPTFLPEDLQQWMATAIKAAKVNTAGFLYRGGLNKTSPRSVQLFVDVEQGHLAYDAQWPDLKAIDGSVVIDNQQVFAHIDKAQVYAGDLLTGTVTWNGDFQKKLHVDADINTSMASGLRFVRESTLQQQTAGALDDWGGGGELDIALRLNLPLFDSSAQAQQNITLAFNDNQLNLREQNLQLSQLGGVLTYDNVDGLSSSNLQAVLFQQPLSLQFDTDASSDALRLSGLGSVDSVALSGWLQQPLDLWLKGKFNYVFDLAIPASSQSEEVSPITLSLFSDLHGAAIDLPTPLTKRLDEKKNFILNASLTTDGWLYQATLGNHLAMSMKDSPQQVLQADIFLADTQTPVVTEPTYDGIRLNAKLQQADAAAWMNVIDSYPSSTSVGNRLPVSFAIDIEQLFYKDIEATNISFSGQREASGWSSIVDGNGIQGGIYWDSDADTPAIVDLDYLRWPLIPEVSAVEAVADRIIQDPWAELSFAELQPVDVTIDQLVYKETLLGQWSFALRPQAHGLEIENIFGAMGGFSIVGDDNNGAHLQWQRDVQTGVSQTRLQANLYGGSLKNLFDLWDLPPLVVNQQTALSAAVSWLGSPAFFSVDRLQGKAHMSLQEGLFIENETSTATGALRLFGLFNFDTWIRRIRLDFSDVFNKGLSFDRLSGKLTFANGLLSISEPFSLTGPSVSMQLEGTIDYPTQTLDGDLAVVLPVGGNLTLATALTAGLPAAAAVYMFRQLFKREVDKASTVNYTVTGKWHEPSIRVRGVDGENLDEIVE
ncbi:MAG: TIGR02099 family protein [Cellvibrionaceae bacterium]|nr:TIGR02099 family protein [Cellvibrionaceae bacterium]